MEITLAENVRKLRKERRLTQEQLAEVLGVTTGAVYKWESGMSVPDISLIMEMADFFDTSVDVLLGYKSKDNRLEAAMSRMNDLIRTRDPKALAEAEKIRKKFPNDFEAIRCCAAVYSFYGVGNGNEENSRRALELLEQARLLISQNTDPRTSEDTILGDMAMIHEMLHEPDKALEIMTKHNPNGMNSDSIGIILATQTDRVEEAKVYLVEGLVRGLFCLVNSFMGEAIILCREGKYSDAQKLMVIGRDLIKGIHRGEDWADFTDKLSAVAYALLAYTYEKTGKHEEACKTLAKAAEYVHRFDATPNYGLAELIVEVNGPLLTHDTLGDSARETVDEVIRYLKDPGFTKLWESIAESPDEAAEAGIAEPEA